MQFLFLLEQVVNGLVLGGLLPADRARPVADLQRRRRGQPCAWRVLRAGRLRFARDRAAAWASAPRWCCRRSRWRCSASSSSASSCAASTRPTRSCRCCVTFGLAMVAEQAIRMIWGAAPLPASMPAGLQGQRDAGRLPVLALPPAAARGGGRGAGRHLAAAAQDLLRARGARRHPAPRHGRGARHPPAALHDDDRGAGRGHGRAGGAPCSRRSRSCIRRWAPRSSPSPSSWS